MSKTKKYNGKNNFKTKTQKGGIKVGKAKIAHTELKTGVYGSTKQGVASTGLHKYNSVKAKYNQSKVNVAKLASTPSPKTQSLLAVFGRSAEQQKQKAEKALLTMYNRTRNSTTPTNSTKPNINTAFFTNLQAKKSAMEKAYDKQKSEAYQAASTPAALQKRVHNSQLLTTKQSELAQLYRKRNTLRENTGKTNRAAKKTEIETLQSTLKAHNLYSGPQSVASLKKEANKGVFSFLQSKFPGRTNRTYKNLTPELVSTLLNTKKAAEEKTIANLSQVSSGSPKVLTLIPPQSVTSAAPSTPPSTKPSPATNNKTLLKKLSKLSAQVLTTDFAVKAAKAQAAYITQKGALTDIIDSQKITLIETSSPTQSYANTKKQIQGLGLKKEQENVLLAKFKIDKQQQLATIRTPTPTSIEP